MERFGPHEALFPTQVPLDVAVDRADRLRDVVQRFSERLTRVRAAATYPGIWWGACPSFARTPPCRPGVAVLDRARAARDSWKGHPVTLRLSAQGELQLVHDTGSLPAAEAKRFAEQLVRALTAVDADPDQRIEWLELLSDEERHAS